MPKNARAPRPSMNEVRMKNPHFFDEIWDRYTSSLTLLPARSGDGWELVADCRLTRPVYRIEDDLTLTYDRNDE